MCDEHRRDKGKKKRVSQGSDFDRLEIAVKQKRQQYLCQQPGKNRLQQGQTLSVSACEPVRKATGKVIFRAIGEKKAVTYTYRQKTIDGLARTFAKALHRVETDAEFERFSRKNTLTIIASSAICTEDAHVANKTAFMFCAEKRANTLSDLKYDDDNETYEEVSSLSSQLPPAKGFNASINQQSKRSCHSSIKFGGNDPASSYVPHDIYMKSLMPGSVLAQMEQCGKDVPISTDEYSIQAFRVDKLTFKGEWDNAPQDIGITMKELIGSGGMRDCYRVVISNLPPHFPVLASDGWVAKFYKKDVSGNAYDLCRKDVQTQAIALQMGKIFRHTIKGLKGFGEFPRIIPSFLVQRKGTADFFTVEPRIAKGMYRKYINNDGQPTPLGRTCEVGQKCLAFAHWSKTFTRGKFLICDVQGTNDALTDLQVASLDIDLFGVGNLGEDVFKTFQISHNCNRYCKLLGIDRKEAICDDREIAVLQKMGITAEEVVANMLNDLTGIVRGSKGCARMAQYKKGNLHQREMPPPPADALTDVIVRELVKVFGPARHKQILLVLVPEVRDRIKAMDGERKLPEERSRGKSMDKEDSNWISIKYQGDKRLDRSASIGLDQQISHLPKVRGDDQENGSKGSREQDISKELLSHMQRQTELMELLVTNQQQAGLQNILYAPFGQAPVATNQVQVPGAQHLFVPGAPFCAPFFGSQPLPVPGVVQPVGHPLSVPVGQSSAGANGQSLSIQSVAQQLVVPGAQQPVAQPLTVPDGVQVVGQPMALPGTAQPLGQPLAVPGAVNLVGQPKAVPGTARPVGQPLTETSVVRVGQPLMVPGGMPLMVTGGQTLMTSKFPLSATGMRFVTVPVPLQAPGTEQLVSNEDIPVTRG